MHTTPLQSSPCEGRGQSQCDSGHLSLCLLLPALLSQSNINHSPVGGNFLCRPDGNHSTSLTTQSDNQPSPMTRSQLEMQKKSPLVRGKGESCILSFSRGKIVLSKVVPYDT